ATPETLAGRCDPGPEAQRDFGGVTVRQRLAERGEESLALARERGVRGGGLLAEGDRLLARRALLGQRDAELPELPSVPTEATTGERVRHLVGDDDSLERRLRQPLEPHDALAQRLRQPCEAPALALGEIGADFEYREALERQPAACGEELRARVRSERAAVALFLGRQRREG